VKRHLLYVVAVGFASGIALESVAPTPILHVFLVFLSIAVAVYARLLLPAPRRLPIILFSIFLFSAAAGVFRFDVFRGFGQDPLGAHVGEVVGIEGVIRGDPDRRLTSTIYVLDVGGGSRVRIIADSYPRYSYGDRVRARGQLRLPENFTTDDGRVFDYVGYLSKDRITYQMLRPRVERIGDNEGNPIVLGLYSMKSWFVGRIERMMPEPISSLMAGILIGEKHALGDELTDIFRRVGLVHIIVLSGYNLTIVANFLMRSFGWMGARGRLFVGAGAIILFSIMVGAGATVIRAAIMSLLVLFARGIHRRYDVSRALVFAAFIMLLHNPAILVFDPSFQLSFLATMGLVYVSPIIERGLFRAPGGSVREILVSTLSTQAFVTPLLLYMTGEFSVVSVLANVAVLPVIPFAMLAGFVSVIVSLVSSTAASLVALIASVTLSYVVRVADVLSGFSFASVSMGSIPVPVVFSIYVCLVWWVTVVHNKRSRIDEPYAPV